MLGAAVAAFFFRNEIGLAAAWYYMIPAVFVLLVAVGFLGVLVARLNANRLSAEKRFKLAVICDRIEREQLAGTDIGIRSGPEAAWVEVGNLAILGSIGLKQSRNRRIFIFILSAMTRRANKGRSIGRIQQCPKTRA